MPKLGLSTGLTRSGIVTPGIVTSNLVLKHNYSAGSVIPVSDGAAHFDGSGDFIVADGTSIDFGTNDFTLALWVNPLADITATYFMSQHANSDNRWYLRLNDSGIVHFYSAIGGSGAIAFNGGNALATNVWTHIAVSIDRDSSTGGKVYVNGALDATSNESAYAAVDYKISTVSPDVAGQEDLNIGRWSSSTSAAKYITNAAVWHRALEQPEIKSIMNKNYTGLTSSETTNLVSWWNLDEGTGTTATDSHGSNDGSATFT